MAMCQKLAGGQIKLKLAQIDGAVALGVSGVNAAAGRNLPRCSDQGRDKGEVGVHREGVLIAVAPVGVGGTADPRVETEMLVGRIGKHIEQRVERHILELRGDLAIDGNHERENRNGDVPRSRPGGANAGQPRGLHSGCTG